MLHLAVVLLILSPFLPGPSFLSTPANLVYSGVQLGIPPARLGSLYTLRGVAKSVLRDWGFRVSRERVLDDPARGGVPGRDSTTTAPPATATRFPVNRTWRRA